MNGRERDEREEDLDEEAGEDYLEEPVGEMEDVADEIFEACEDDVVCISARLDALDPDLRWDLLGSNLLNAWQVFYYIFRLVPDELVRERLELEPALAARTGILIEERDLFEILFFVKERRGFIGVSDGEALLAHFEGPDAYHEARSFVDKNA